MPVSPPRLRHRHRINGYPSLTYSLAVNSINATLVESDNNNGERALIIAISDAVKDKEIKMRSKPGYCRNIIFKRKRAPKHQPISILGIWMILTIICCNNQRRWRWPSMRPSKSISQYSALSLMPSYRTLLIEVNNSLTSVGGYKCRKNLPNSQGSRLP